jgi:hypothetical protein
MRILLTPLNSSTSPNNPTTLSTGANRNNVNRDAIPWPALAKLVAPSHLKRTASNLMSEWERSLTPSPSPTATSRRGSPGPTQAKVD